jgi:hypothetical protein
MQLRKQGLEFCDKTFSLDFTSNNIQKLTDVEVNSGICWGSRSLIFPLLIETSVYICSIFFPVT